MFCLGVNRLLEKHNSEMTRVIAYADDFVIMSKSMDELANTWENFQSEAEALGLEINITKTKLLLDKRTPMDKTSIDGLKINLKPRYYNDDYIWSYLDIPISKNKENIITHCILK